MSSRKRRRRLHRKVRRRIRRTAWAIVCIVLVIAIGVAAAVILDRRFTQPVENAGRQLTVYRNTGSSPQYYVDGQWIVEKDLDTLLVIGIDDFGAVANSESYNNSNQADFMVLIARDRNTGKSSILHLNRDTMADIPVLGVTGKKAGTIKGQLALAYTYGSGRQDSCENTVEAASNLLYGVGIDHYITITMDAVPILNDWAGGVEVEVIDDFSGVDDTLVKGRTVTLMGDHALNYVRTRKDLNDSSNIRRMERQRQYASAWMDKAKALFEDEEKVLELVMNLSDYHYSDCSAGDLAGYAEAFAHGSGGNIYQLQGRNVQGEKYMEYYIDETAVQKLVTDLFFEPVVR